jgi:hypothetical protein
MRSAFGVDHGEISKGLPSAVKAGGGGRYGKLMRHKNALGQAGAKSSYFRDTNSRVAGHVKSTMRSERNYWSGQKKGSLP